MVAMIPVQARFKLWVMGYDIVPAPSIPSIPRSDWYACSLPLRSSEDVVRQSFRSRAKPGSTTGF